jgi:aspartate-semialdehyde dehydrogenase
MKIAIVGATGLVGRKMLQVLEEFNLPITDIVPVASAKSVGKSIVFKGVNYKVHHIEEASEAGCDIALFSAGSAVSFEWAPRFAEKGCYVIDNSSCWRMQDNIPLVVPEINADLITHESRIIANPNCSTIQMVMALNPIHLKYGVKRIIVSTYQSVSGTGAKALEQLADERNQRPAQKVYPYPIDLNILPHIDSFTENGFTKEEMKMINETRKIMRAPNIAITATTVRVPVRIGHSESVYFETERDTDLDAIRNLWLQTPGIIVQDDVKNNLYPMPLFCEDRNEVFVGRLRKDLSQPRAFNCWIVADNLRKGAATNAVQIAEHLINHKLINAR